VAFVKAVLLAAGRGSRLGATDLPKPLWEIGPRSATDPAPVTILERQVRCLEGLGVRPIVVVGHEKERVRAGIKGASFVENTHKDIAASGSALSFQFAVRSPLRPLDGEEPCLLMDCDLVYERRLLEAIVGGRGGTRLFVAERRGGDDEEVRVYARDRAMLLGKGLGPPVTDGLTCLGEATGIVRFEPRDHALVAAALDWILARGPARLATEHEDLEQMLFALGRLGAERLDPDLLFAEADFPEDFERVRRDLYPRILARDAK
jgi:choline kinase